MRRMKPAKLKYQPYYCEENAWWLCHDEVFAGTRRAVAFISNPDRTCCLCHQRAGGEAGIVAWDYHVVFLVQDGDAWWVWDPDTQLGVPTAAGDYLRKTFAVVDHVPPEYAPRFRVVEAERFIATFSTDRSHMRGPDGQWLHTPPPWNPPRAAVAEPMNLMRFVDMGEAFEGEVFDLTAMLSRYG